MIMTRRSLAFWGSILLLAGFGAFCGGSGDHAASDEAKPTAAPAPLKAVAELKPTEGNSVAGTVTFEEGADGSVHITGKVSGLTPGKHGFHIHAVGDCSAADGSSAGGHFNPDGTDHGAPDSPTHHVGDLGNLEADEQGNAEYHANYNFLTLKDGPHSVIGKAVIVHSGEDDLVTQPTGGAGSRLACGVIEKQ